MRAEKALARDEGVNFLDQFFGQKRLVENGVGLDFVLLKGLHFEVAAVKNGAEIGMRLAAARHEIHAVERLHHEIGDEQVGLGFSSFEGFEGVERRGEKARVEAFHGEKGADNFADHRFVIDDEDGGFVGGCDALSPL